MPNDGGCDMKQQKKDLPIWLGTLAGLLLLALIAGGGRLALRTRLVSMLLITAILLIAAALIRLLAIPKFTIAPGRFQLLLETLVGFFIPKPKQKAPAPVYKAAAPRGPSLGERLKKLPPAIGGWIVRNKTAFAVWVVIVGALLAGSIAVGSHGGHGDVQSAMRDAVLHDVNRVSLFGLKDVNPALIAAMTVSGILLVAAILIRLLVIPKFTEVPGKFQMVLETIVETLDGMAGVGKADKPSFIGGYVFAAGVYIFCSTLFELFGIQAVTTTGHSVALPAPLSDVNAAIAMGCLSYLVIFFGGLIHAGGHGAGAALKEFSLPISMSFRLFGALLSGLLVTELVYHYVKLSFVLPVVVGVLFTLLHALVQSYVLTMLVGMYYHEVTEKHKPKE